MAAFGVLNAQIIPLEAPNIISVNVDTATGLASIKWAPITSQALEKYTVYYYTPGITGAIAIDTVPREINEYVYPESLDPSQMAQTLTVAGVDTLGSGGLLPDPPHKTMFLTTHYDSCAKTMELEWSSYVGWGNDLVRYEVYFSVDGDSYSFLDQSFVEDTTMSQLDIKDNRSYCYFVKAIKNDNTVSFSNIACRNVTHPLYPAWIDAESASAVDRDQVEVKFAVDSAGEITSFQLFKSAGPGKPFIQDAIIRDVVDSFTYNDPVLSTELSWQYKLYALDVCDNINPETESNICGNIVLDANSAGLAASLSWQPYEKYEAGVDRYQIYRRITGAEPELIGEVFHPETSYEDDLNSVSGSDIEDEICYYVVAVENDSYTRGNRGYSRSNQACVSVVPEIMMANAIIPNSTIIDNTKIGPELSFIPREYLFQVFDRWGNKIFQTTDSGVLWEGRVNNRGQTVPEGVYVYYIKLTTTGGIEVVKTGEITVFYN